MSEDEQEEDFFAMLTADEKVITGTGSGSGAEISSGHTDQPPSAEPFPIHQSRHSAAGAEYHDMASDSELDEHIRWHHPSQGPDSNIKSGDDFEETLRWFYSKYNFGNLDKVAFLASKFTDRRWELWEQLSMKYRLSPTEARELWIRFHVQHSGLNECAKRLFGLSEIIIIPDESMVARKGAWRTILGVHSGNSEQRSLYQKYVAELAPTDVISGLCPESSDIVRDVHRTHQELGFFREV